MNRRSSTSGLVQVIGIVVTRLVSVSRAGWIVMLQELGWGSDYS